MIESVKSVQCITLHIPHILHQHYYMAHLLRGCITHCTPHLSIQYLPVTHNVILNVKGNCHQETKLRHKSATNGWSPRSKAFNRSQIIHQCTVYTALAVDNRELQCNVVNCSQSYWTKLITG